MARLNNGLTPGENGKIVASIITEDDLDELQKLHSELLTRVDSARTDGRLFMMGQYVRLVALISPEIDRVERRFKREVLASVRKEHKMLKLEAKEAAENGATA
jgi:hypothetical protein